VASGASAEPELVFGYGSLVFDLGVAPTRARAAEGFVCDLVGFRRRWDVAMDNAVTVPGYKYYVDRRTGHRPEVFVTFLNLSVDRDAAINGVAVPMSQDDLRRLDERERNYERVEVTEAIRPPSTRRVWTYLGHKEARERYRLGAASGAAVVSREYYAAVVSSFQELGDAEIERFWSSTDRPDCPLLDLVVVDVPGH
jgi:cation transport regulator ChaC